MFPAHIGELWALINLVEAQDGNNRVGNMSCWREEGCGREVRNSFQVTWGGGGSCLMTYI
jgi:hypothetical protein